MTDADADVEENLDENEQPDIDDDEFADIDLDAIADEVEETAGAGKEDDDLEPDPDEDVDESTSDQEESGGLPNPDATGENWGDMYVGTLTTLSNAAIEEFGKEGVEQVDEDLARQLHLDEYFNDWMQSKGKREDMPPEQALMIATSVFLVTVIGTKTDLPSELLGEISA